MSKTRFKSIFADTLINVYFLLVPILYLMAPNDEVGKIQMLSKWPQFLGLLGFSLGIAIVFERLNLHSLGKLVAKVEKNYSAGVPLKGRIWLWQLSLFLVLTIFSSVVVTRLSINELFDKEGFAGAMRLFAGLLTPNFTILPRVLIHITETIYTAFIASFVALPISFLLSFVSARNLIPGRSGFLIYRILRLFLNLVRSVEPLIWAVIFSVWVGIGPFAGMLALLVHSVASLTKQFSEIIEGAQRGPVQGIESTGANPIQTIWFGVVPQVFLPFISFSIYRWDINVRMATVIGLVGGGGVGTMLIQYQGQAMWPEVGCIIFVIAMVVWIMDSISAHLREALK